MIELAIPVYWDTSALVSALLEDVHTAEAQAWYATEGVHLASSLGAAELFAGFSRLGREGLEAQDLARATENFRNGWIYTSVSPDPALLLELSQRWPLRGADLWHLGLAATLREERADLVLLTFDENLRIAAEGEGLDARA